MEGVVTCVVHQCMTGLRDPDTKFRVKKPTLFVASHEILLRNLQGLQCDGKHQHGRLEGTYQGQNKLTWPGYGLGSWPLG